MSRLRLDELPLRHAARVIAIDWSRLREKEARRLRELGFDEGVAGRSASIPSPAASAG
jgi:ferrous iron transport protein A